MTTPTHQVRPHLFTDEQSFALEPDALVFVSKGKSVLIPYSDITSVRVLSYASYGGVQFQCTLKTRSHGKLNIRSHHFRSLGAFDDRTATFFPLARELCLRVEAHNPQAQFIRGSGWIQTLWLIVLIICVFGWILLGFILVEGGADPMASLGYVGVLVLATYFSVRWSILSKPDLFDPAAPPL